MTEMADSSDLRQTVCRCYEMEGQYSRPSNGAISVLLQSDGLNEQTNQLTCLPLIFFVDLPQSMYLPAI